jgi:bifunctional non-homologous end joining protein LigD
LGALQLADYVNGELVYGGRVGTGFDEALLKELNTLLAPIVRSDPVCSGPIIEDKSSLPSDAIPETSTTTWVEAKYVCEVRFREWTPDGLLRHATFLRLREDKETRECERQGWSIPDEPVPNVAAAAPTSPPIVQEKRVAFTNLNKVYWPKEGYTKGDLIEYYRAISPWLLPYLRNRPVVLTRFPDGIEGKSFYQKDAPDHVPSWIRTGSIWSNDTQRFIRYFVCDDSRRWSISSIWERSRYTYGTVSAGRSSSQIGV